MRAGHDIQHITLTLMREDLPRASLVLAELGAFAPDDRSRLDSELPEVPGNAFRARVRRAWGHYDRLSTTIADLAGSEMPRPVGAKPMLTLRREKLVEVDEWLAGAWKHCAPCDVAHHRLEDEYNELSQLEQSLEDFADFNVDLSRLQGELAHLDLRIGTLPGDNVERVRDVLTPSKHLVIELAEHEGTLRVLVAGRREDAKVLDSVLHAAAFQPLQIPASFDDNPEELRADLADRRFQLEQQSKELRDRMLNWFETNGEQLAEARQLLEAAEAYVNVRGAARSRGPLASMQGWAPRARLARLRAQLDQGLTLPYVLESRAPRPDERHLVPVPAQARGLLKPFSILVEQYGVPRFGEFDPTVLFAITFVGMFGMMFGDIGHGAVIVLLGFLLRHKIASFTYLFYLAGTSSMVFGWMYGSIFGVEHWIHPLWIAPMSDPIYMLTVALNWGVAFLTLGSVIAISNRLLSGDQTGALFEPGGLISLVMYLALLGGLVSLAQGSGFPLVAKVLAALTLTVLAVYQWRESRGTIGERIFTTLIETFEIVNGYLASSLSFLRIAAFSLNHVALSLAVFTLADGMGTVGHWITLVLGNIFIIVLEGVIVTIQTLRLEYYEGFSRYFYGDGTPFRPLRAGRTLTR